MPYPIWANSQKRASGAKKGFGGMNFPACPGRLSERGKRLCLSLTSSADEVKNFLIIGMPGESLRKRRTFFNKNRKSRVQGLSECV